TQAAVTPSGRCIDAEATSKYTILFAAKPAEVRAIFLGWREPVAPHEVVGKNPFTGKEITVQSREPTATPPGPEAAFWAMDDGALPAGTAYDRYVASRTPPPVRALPHGLVKRAELRMMPIDRVVTGSDDVPVALYPPSGCTSGLPLLVVPAAVVRAVKAANDDALAKLAADVQRADALEELSIDDARELLEELRALAPQAGDGAAMCLLPV
ncbi:MAG TPA: hypothetical protein VIY73_11075, partial [Polyangiaceae bacterium]